MFVEAVLYRYRAGIPWPDLPPRFGDYKIVHQRFGRWAKSGVSDRILKLLASDADNEYVRLDATIVRAHQHGAGARKKGGDQATAGSSPKARSRGGPTTKINALVDALGNPVAIVLTPGQAHDLQAAPALFAEIAPGALIADKAYDADGLIGPLVERGIAPVIPPKRNRTSKRPCDFALYRERNLIERSFSKLEQSRAIAARYDKTARNFLAGTKLAAAAILLR